MAIVKSALADKQEFTGLSTKYKDIKKSNNEGFMGIELQTQNTFTSPVRGSQTGLTD